MKFAKFLHRNIKWNFDKNIFADLCCAPTEESVLIDQFHRLSDKYYPQKKPVETAYTEFCLNEIALAAPKTPAQKFVKQQFGEMWRTFLRLKSTFDKPFALFAADEKQTRLEAIAKLIVQCTQFALSRQSLDRICERAFEIIDFDEREKRNLNNALELFRINYFCAVARGIFKKSKLCEIRLAKMMDACSLGGEYCHNTQLRQIGYATKRLASCINCLGNSATKFSVPTQTEVKPFFFCNGRNVFDTFCYSKLGNKTAQFFSQNGTLKVEMQYFLQGNCEVRRYRLHNVGKVSKQITADFLFRHLNASDKTNYFPADGALGLAITGEEEFYCALALVCDGKIVQCDFEEGRLAHIFDIPCDQKVNFALVTCFAESMPELADILQDLNCFGTTRCPYLFDTLSSNVTNTKLPLNPTSHGFLSRQTPPKEATVFNFTYQFGDASGATFLDNAGNCTTLLNGFAFGISGEKVFSVKNGTMRQLYCGKFSLDGDSIIYKKAGDVCCNLHHKGGKTYKIEYNIKQKTLFYFPLEEKSEITFDNNIFYVKSALRQFEIRCVGEVESYTSNALECNADRMRYKLSCNLQIGSCLAICFAASTSAEVTVCGGMVPPTSCPIVRESLVSTYLNYVNDKNAFCLYNFLKRADALTLAAINFTNPEFVKFFATNLFENSRFFYDVAGQKQPFFDKLALPLAIVYYANITNDEKFPTDELKKYASSIIFSENFSGKQLCVKALALKKAANVKGFDKMKCLVEYNNLRKQILGDVKLYAYAQAIGAVPMNNPSKERLKDLCTQFDIPKSWYYVSQLENLYGMSLVDGTLNFAPKVSQENVLEQLALNIFGKRIDTVFLKSSVQSLTLNGVQYFLPLKMQSLKNAENTLEVRY